MARSVETGAGFRNGDLVWIAAVGEWCEIYNMTSTASWSYIRPSNGATASGPQDLTLYPPHLHRPAAVGDRPPKP